MPTTTASPSTPTAPVTAMLNVSADGYGLTVTEACGITYRPQVVKIPLPVTELANDSQLHLRDEPGNITYIQRSQIDGRYGFVFLEIAAYSTRVYQIGRDDGLQETPMHHAEPSHHQFGRHPTIIIMPKYYEITNGKVGLRISRGGAEKPALYPVGAVLGICHQNGNWFGDTYFDTLQPLPVASARIIERGEWRVVIEYARGSHYRALFTLDADTDFCAIDETFHANESDQLVWIFTGAALPPTGYFLTSTPSYETRALGYYMDQELAKLGCWSQQSQMNLSDGFAFAHPHENTVFGAVTLTGNLWRGHRLNSLDAYMRRLRNGDHATRRLVPPGAKSDTLPGPLGEYNPERDAGDCESALTWEGWLGEGRRRWALTLMTAEELRPAAGDDLTLARRGVELSHFENSATSEFCLTLQSPLRKRHIENVIPVDELWLQSFAVGTPAPFDWNFTANTPFLRSSLAWDLPEADIFSPEFITHIENYITARVVTFFDGAGIASTNPVSSRRVGPSAFFVEEAAARGLLSGERLARLRAKLIYLALLNNDQGFYAGYYAMLPPREVDSFDPSMRGMANQNFYTDVITIYAFAGLLYPQHPRANQWVEDFIAAFTRQMAVHSYPSGIWEESHTYCQHVVFTVLPILKMLKQRGRFDFFATEKLQKMMWAITEQVSIADAVIGGRRALVALGDHELSPEPYCRTWGAYAAEFAAVAPELAARLNYLARACGGYPEANLPETAPAPGNREIKALGVFFRGVSREGAETLCVLRSGAAWGHHHNDDGSIQLFCGDRLLLGDAGHSGRLCGEYKGGDAGHSRWLVKGVTILNYRGRYNRGWVIASQLNETAEQLPYAAIYSPALYELKPAAEVPLPRALRHYRAVVKLSANSFLVLDATIEPCAEQIVFHLGAPDLTIDESARSATAQCGKFLTRVTVLTADTISRGLRIDGGAPTPAPDAKKTAPEKDAATRQTAAVNFTPTSAQFYSAFIINFGETLETAPRPGIDFTNNVFTVTVAGHAPVQFAIGS